MSQVALVELSDGTRTFMNDRLINTMLERQRQQCTGPGCHGKGHPSCQNCIKNDKCNGKGKH